MLIKKEFKEMYVCKVLTLSPEADSALSLGVVITLLDLGVAVQEIQNCQTKEVCWQVIFIAVQKHISHCNNFS